MDIIPLSDEQRVYLQSFGFERVVGLPSAGESFPYIVLQQRMRGSHGIQPFALHVGEEDSRYTFGGIHPYVEMSDFTRDGETVDDAMTRLRESMVDTIEKIVVQNRGDLEVSPSRPMKVFVNDDAWDLSGVVRGLIDRNRKPAKADV